MDEMFISCCGKFLKFIICDSLYIGESQLRENQNLDHISVDYGSWLMDGSVTYYKGVLCIFFRLLKEAKHGAYLYAVIEFYFHQLRKFCEEKYFDFFVLV